MISKILFPLLFYTFIQQDKLFPETFFVYPISEQRFTVCVSNPSIMFVNEIATLKVIGVEERTVSRAA